jgi:alkylation response protein AidB-like acyl-CoA dehydrogenase
MTDAQMLPQPGNDQVPDLATVLPGIRGRADQADRTGRWPAEDLRALAEIGAMRWQLPREAGGDDVPAVELHLRYEAIASASLATALILSQRDSAAGLIDGAESDALRQELLPALASNQAFSTVGIAQLTTSRQGGPPALIAFATHDGYRLEGIIPWATGAAHCDFVVSGAVCAGNPAEQILFVLPTSLPGVIVQPAIPMVALAASQTTAISCQAVELSRRWILTGPRDRVLGNRRKAVAIGQTFPAMGLCRSALDLIARHDSARARHTHRKLADQLDALRTRVLAFCSSAAPDPHDAPQLRGACNDLSLRITHAAVALFKGAALMADHPAQRLAREAMFLLVWSCPDPVIDCTVELLSE